MKAVRILVAALLATSGLVAVGLTTQTAQAAAANTITAGPAKPMKYESFTLSGKLSTPVARTVRFQYKSSGKWKNLKTTTTNSLGEYSTATRSSKSRTYRIYAPKATISTTKYKAIVGKAKKVNLVAQKASAFVTPNQICVFSWNDPVTAVASFSPARPGREVSFLLPNGSTVTGEQDGAGHVAIQFTPPEPDTDTYQVIATAQPFNGASAKSAPPAKYKIGFGYCNITPL